MGNPSQYSSQMINNQSISPFLKQMTAHQSTQELINGLVLNKFLINAKTQIENNKKLSQNARTNKLKGDLKNFQNKIQKDFVSEKFTKLQKDNSSQILRSNSIWLKSEQNNSLRTSQDQSSFKINLGKQLWRLSQYSRKQTSKTIEPSTISEENNIQHEKQQIIKEILHEFINNLEIEKLSKTIKTNSSIYERIEVESLQHEEVWLELDQIKQKDDTDKQYKLIQEEYDYFNYPIFQYLDYQSEQNLIELDSNNAIFQNVAYQVQEFFLEINSPIFEILEYQSLEIFTESSEIQESQLQIDLKMEQKSKSTMKAQKTEFFIFSEDLFQPFETTQQKSRNSVLDDKIQNQDEISLLSHEKKISILQDQVTKKLNEIKNQQTLIDDLSNNGSNPTFDSVSTQITEPRKSIKEKIDADGKVAIVQQKKVRASFKVLSKNLQKIVKKVPEKDEKKVDLWDCM